MKFWNKRRSAQSKMGKGAADAALGGELQTAVSSEAVQLWLNNSPQQSRALSRQSLQVPGQRLVPSKSLPRLSVSSLSSEESWHRPQVRILHYPPAVPQRCKSTYQGFQGPLYKEIIYSSVNMNSSEALFEKELKACPFSRLPSQVFNTPTPASKSGKDITALGSPSSAKVFPSVQTVPRPREEQSRVPKIEYRRSPIGSAAPSTQRESVYGTTRVVSNSPNCPKCREEALQSSLPQKGLHVVLPQTSTPKQRICLHNGGQCTPQCLVSAKSVHFAPVVLSPIAPGSPPGYRPPPVGSCSKQDCTEFPVIIATKDDEPSILSAQNEHNEDTQSTSSQVLDTFTDPTQVPDDSLLRRYLTLEVDSCLTKGTAVHHWLKDIRVVTELECLSVLQAKSLVTDPSRIASLAIRNAQTAILALRSRTESLLVDFKCTLSTLSKKTWTQFSMEASQLLAALQEMLQDYRTGSTLILDTSKTEIRLKRACEDLSEFVERNKDHWVSEERKASIRHTLKSMQECFRELSEHLVMQELKVIIGALEDEPQEQSLRVALAAITSLAQSGEALCQLIAKADGVRSLLSLCVENKWLPLRAATLRALTIICCVPEAVQRLDEAGGMECISDVLCETSEKETVQSEAAGLLAQITAPWMECEAQNLRGLIQNLDLMIKALTDLAEKTESVEVLLLSAAALANLSFLDTEACLCFSRNNTPQALVEACRNRHDSLFVKDQVSTVLANMAAVESCRSSLVKGGAPVLLLCFLQVRPSTLYTSAETEACERLQQKSAIALARLCTEKNMASCVAAMQGVKRLVRLCKDEKERNNSDSVLVAALAALRKIATACGLSEFESLKAVDLVVPPLWDSFRMYSSKQESYV